METAYPRPAGCLSHPIQPPHSCQAALSKKQIPSGFPRLGALRILTGFSQKASFRDVCSPLNKAWMVCQHHCSLATRPRHHPDGTAPLLSCLRLTGSPTTNPHSWPVNPDSSGPDLSLFQKACLCRPGRHHLPHRAPSVLTIICPQVGAHK